MIMNKYELIENIQNLESESESSNYRLGFEKAKYWCLTLTSNLEESEAEQVEVPLMIDKFIKDHTDPIFEICAWSDHYGNDGRTCDDPELSVVLEWYGNNTTEFYNAVVNGYTVNPKRWVIKRKSSIALESFKSRSIDPVWTTEEPLWMTFDNKTTAEAVALLVDGNVEEVAE